MSELEVRAAKRSFHQKYLTDPLVGIFVILLWTLFRILPIDKASTVGSWCGTKFRYLLPRKHKVALYNLKKCFPNKTDAEREAIANAMWAHMGAIMGEMPHAHKMKDRIEIEGMEYVKQMREDGKGGFICSAHLGNWELCCSITMQLGLPIHLVYRAANNPWIEKAIFSHRRVDGVELIPKGATGAKKMIELLRRGEHVGILCDQKLREGIDVPFFGYPAKTPPGIATLALKYDLVILPTQIIRLKGAHYKCIFHAPIKLPHTGDKAADTLAIMTEINQMYEDWITQHPEQWLWIHHRWDKKEYPK